MKIGIGYDVHELKKEAKFIVGGVEIESNYGCISHSDGDALTHAVIDSILGAAGKGDIGQHFPPEDKKYENLSSLNLLEKTIEIISDFKIINIDCTFVAQIPVLKPYRYSIEKKLSDCCKISINQINVKFKTEEKLGFTGEIKGVKAIAICLLEEK